MGGAANTDDMAYAFCSHWKNGDDCVVAHLDLCVCSQM